jgi:hypothetical protein
MDCDRIGVAKVCYNRLARGNLNILHIVEVTRPRM